MSRNVIETVMGAVVLVIAGSFLITAYQGRSLSKVNNGYHVKAKFENATGVSVGSDVRMGGVKIGIVDGIDLDTERYQAVVTMSVRANIPLPLDSTAAIVGDGLLGSKFVALEPGAEEETLKDGGEIEFTQSSVSLEEMIGKFVFSGGGVDDGASPKDPPASDAAPSTDTAPAEENGAAPAAEEDELKLNF